MDNNVSFPASNPNMALTVDSADTEKYANLPSGMVRRSNSVRSTASSCSRSSTPCSIATSIPTSPTTQSPDTIILSLWPHATTAQIDFYIAGYETLYPTAQILLLQSSWLRATPDLENVLDILTRTCEKPLLQAPTVLLHLFGHTGALNACALLRAYRARTSEPMNIKAIVSDTEPRISVSTLAHSAQSPSQLLALLFAFLLNFLTSLGNLWSADTHDNSIRSDLTNPLLLPSNVRKCFVFARQDVMFSWCEDGEHGKEAERRDYTVKRTSVDVHGRWTGDQERYWLGIEGVWEGW